ncbi:MAG: hypothetical protein AAFX81_00695 [Pseudomonadota bacterium]
MDVHVDIKIVTKGSVRLVRLTDRADIAALVQQLDELAARRGADAPVVRLSHHRARAAG